MCITPIFLSASVDGSWVVTAKIRSKLLILAHLLHAVGVRKWPVWIWCESVLCVFVLVVCTLSSFRCFHSPPLSCFSVEHVLCHSSFVSGRLGRAIVQYSELVINKVNMIVWFGMIQCPKFSVCLWMFGAIQSGLKKGSASHCDVEGQLLIKIDQHMLFYQLEWFLDLSPWENVSGSTDSMVR